MISGWRERTTVEQVLEGWRHIARPLGANMPATNTSQAAGKCEEKQLLGRRKNAASLLSGAAKLANAMRLREKWKLA